MKFNPEHVIFTSSTEHLTIAGNMHPAEDSVALIGIFTSDGGASIMAYVEVEELHAKLGEWLAAWR